MPTSGWGFDSPSPRRGFARSKAPNVCPSIVLVLLVARQLDSQSGDTGSNPVEDAKWFGPSRAICLRTHLVKRSDCRSDEGSSILLGGAAFGIVCPGDFYD